MAPGRRVSRQTTITGASTQASRSSDPSNSNNSTPNTDDSTRTRKGRGRTMGKGLEKMKKSMRRKMVIDIPVGKGRPVEAISSAKLSNELGIIARNFLSLPNKWKELTREDKDAALIRCHEKFEINLDEHYNTKDSCEDILKNRSRQWRYKLKKLFESASSVEEARKIEVPELTPKNWNRLYDFLANPEHKRRCEINKVNRTKLKSNHFMGSRAFVAAHAEIGVKEHEGVEPNRIELYKSTHYSSEKGWSSPEAETNYNKMRDLRARSVSEENPMTIDEIVDNVLGTRSGYIKGLGYGPKPSTTTATKRRTAELEDALRRAKEDAATAQHGLQERLNVAETEVANQQIQIQTVTSELGTLRASQEEILNQMKRHFIGSSPSKLEVLHL
ncbi:hypothetical protein A4A49_52839 [Nicotiana attenuata]|uniref:Transposase, Ptta/En/Spm, plant n=1 Tax=Nicotiana attenuata TaxID=49451 RepID=A0A1J6JZ74_NICAT|nr:hypothetical protein A4A49_52839 [Nicotiana attenuata]